MANSLQSSWVHFLNSAQDFVYKSFSMASKNVHSFKLALALALALAFVLDT